MRPEIAASAFIGWLILQCAVLGGCATRLTYDDTDLQLAQLLVAAAREGTPPPRVSAQGYQLDVESAYKVQRAALDLLYPGAVYPGYKAGLTSPGSPSRFGLQDPVAAVLPPESRLSMGRDGIYTLRTGSFSRPMIELELGFELATDIRDADISIAELMSKVKAVYPVLELPDLGFAEGPPGGLDVIAANVAARYFVQANTAFAPDSDLSAMEVALYLDGNQVMTGIGRDAMGDPWVALQWLVKQRLEHGWPLRAGHLLITGALGKMMPVSTGTYRAEFGSENTLKLLVHSDL